MFKQHLTDKFLFVLPYLLGLVTACEFQGEMQIVQKNGVSLITCPIQPSQNCNLSWNYDKSYFGEGKAEGNTLEFKNLRSVS